MCAWGRGVESATAVSHGGAFLSGQSTVTRRRHTWLGKLRGGDPRLSEDALFPRP